MDYESMVAQDEADEASRKKKLEDDAENAAIEAAKNSPQARMLAGVNAAATDINMSEMEATIQSQLQAKMQAGATKEELLASVGTDIVPVPQLAATSVVQQVLA